MGDYPSIFVKLPLLLSLPSTSFDVDINLKYYTASILFLSDSRTIDHENCNDDA